MKANFPHRSALAAISLALPASAEVIYSNLQNIAIPATYDGLYLNVENGTWNTDMFSPVSGWDINPYFGGSVLFNSPTFQPVRSGNGNMDAVLNLSLGTSVSGSSVFSTFVQPPGGENPGGPGYGGSDTHLGGGVGRFTAGAEGYLGFRLNGTNYGWMRVVLTNNTGGALIKDWAYDNSGGTINTGNVLQNGSTVTLNSAFGSFTLGSQLTGSNNVIKTGGNTATLTGVNNYSGTTTVSAGTLSLASGASLSNTTAVSVGTGATLAGVGTIGGSTTIEGLHSPGGSPGVQTFESGLSYATGATLHWELDANSLGLRGSDFDGIDVNGGNLSIADGVTSNLVFNGSGSTVKWTDTFWDTSRSWLVYDNANTASLASGSIFDTINVSLDSDGSTLAGSRGAFSWGISGNDVRLVYTAVPEPRAALLGGLGLLMLLRRRR
jgi:autotransporter-associated beta strand protein